MTMSATRKGKAKAESSTTPATNLERQGELFATQNPGKRIVKSQSVQGSLITSTTPAQYLERQRELFVIRNPSKIIVSTQSLQGSLVTCLGEALRQCRYISKDPGRCKAMEDIWARRKFGTYAGWCNPENGTSDCGDYGTAGGPIHGFLGDQRDDTRVGDADHTWRARRLGRTGEHVWGGEQAAWNRPNFSDGQGPSR